MPLQAQFEKARRRLRPIEPEDEMLFVPHSIEAPASVRERSRAQREERPLPREE